MKKILTLLIMAVFVTVAAHADDFTRASSKVTQKMVTAEVRDPRGTGGSNQAPYIEFTNRTGQTVTVDFNVYFGGKKVDSKTVKFSGKTHKELFNSIDARSDKFKQKKFTVSICVKKIGGAFDDNM